MVSPLDVLSRHSSGFVFKSVQNTNKKKKKKKKTSQFSVQYAQYQAAINFVINTCSAMTPKTCALKSF